MLQGLLPRLILSGPGANRDDSDDPLIPQGGTVKTGLDAARLLVPKGESPPLPIPSNNGSGYHFAIFVEERPLSKAPFVAIHFH